MVFARAITIAWPLAFDHAGAAGAHQAEGQRYNPDSHNQVEETGDKAEGIGVMLGVEQGNQGNQPFGHDEELSQALAAALLCGIAQNPYGAEPGSCQNEEYERNKQIADTITAIMAAGCDDRIKTVGDP